MTTMSCGCDCHDLLGQPQDTPCGKCAAAHEAIARAEGDETAMMRLILDELDSAYASVTRLLHKIETLRSDTRRFFKSKGLDDPRLS